MEDAMLETKQVGWVGGVLELLIAEKPEKDLGGKKKMAGTALVGTSRPNPLLGPVRHARDVPKGTFREKKKNQADFGNLTTTENTMNLVAILGKTRIASRSGHATPTKKRRDRTVSVPQEGSSPLTGKKRQKRGNKNGQKKQNQATKGSTGWLAPGRNDKERLAASLISCEGPAGGRKGEGKKEDQRPNTPCVLAAD